MPILESHMCPACGLLGKCEFAGDQYYVTCNNCGEFQITRTAGHILQDRLREPTARQKFCYAVRKRFDNNVRGVLGSSDIDNLITNTTLPKPLEQLDDLILYIGNNSKGIGDWIGYRRNEIRARVGAWDESNISALIVAMRNEKITVERAVDGSRHDGALELSLEGWRRYDEIQTRKVVSRTAFMAMPFGEPLIEEMLTECFRPSVESTGFELLKVNDRQIGRAHV